LSDQTITEKTPMTILTFSTRRDITFWLIWLIVALTALFQPWHASCVTADPVIAGYEMRPNAASPVAWIGTTQRRRWALARWLVQRWLNAWQIRLALMVRVWGCHNLAEISKVLTRRQVTLQLGALPVLVMLLERLKVRETINRYCPTQGQVDHGAVALVLVLNRLIAPRPLYKIADWMATTMIEFYLGVAPSKFNDDRLERTLDALAEHLPEIWNDIRQQALLRYKIDLSVLFYDLTALIMTGKYAESALVDYGFAHNTPSDDPKLKLGLTASRDGGIPLLFQPWSGRTADKATVRTNMQQLQIFLKQQGWDSQQVLVVGDCANLNSELALAYEDAHLRYLAGLPKLEKVHRQLLLAPTPKDFQQHLLTNRSDPEGYWGVPCAVPFTHNGRTVTHRGLIVLSAPMQRALREQRQEDLQALYQALQQVKSKIGQKRYRSEKELHQRASTQLKHSPVGNLLQTTVTTSAEGSLDLRWRVVGAAWRLAEQADGRYLLVTNDPKLSYRQMLTLYRQKDAVEKRFKVCKQEIKLRPLHVHSDERIQAMLLINLIALLVYSLIERQAQQHGLCLTTRSILEKLANLQVQHIQAWDGSQSCSFSHLTPEQHALLVVLLQAVDDLPRWSLPAADNQPFLLLPSAPSPRTREAPLPS
jgi:transposase